MYSPPKPENESKRLALLQSLNILETQPQPEFDELTSKAASIFSVPIALVSLIDEERQWFKSIIGLDVCETSRKISFCGHAILQDDVYYVSNTLSDIRFSDNPLVTGEPKIRFYAGAPLTVRKHKIGTLCIIDTKPRSFSRRELKQLRQLADELQLIIESNIPT